MDTLKIAIVDFWKPGNEMMNDYFFRLIKKYYHVTLSDDPDYLFFSVFGNEHQAGKYDNCVKVMYTGENRNPAGYPCDYSFSFYPTSATNFCLPNFARFDEFQQLRSNTYSFRYYRLRNAPKERFCNFVYSNSRAPERIAFFHALSGYKQIDAAGKVLNNVPKLPPGYDLKMQFLSQYKFTIAFENESFINYTTEKMTHPFLAGSIPIYWGNENVSQYFNEKAFINVHSFSSYSDAIAWIREIDTNDLLYDEIRSQKPVLESSDLYTLTEERLTKRLQEIFSRRWQNPQFSGSST